MNWLLVLLAAAFFSVSPAFAANFSPTVLTISAPAHVQYHFDGSPLNLPVNISGTPASVSFLVFTKDRGPSIGKVRNGYLGWHYVNSIDTCVYFSDPIQFAQGSGTLVWNGKDQDGISVEPGIYTYYLFGYDDENPKTKASTFIQTRTHDAFLRFQEKGPDGKPMANPFVYNSRYFEKWILGDDPDISGLLETTKVRLPESFQDEGCGQAMMPIIQPDDFNYLFIEIGNRNTQTQAIAKYKWIPNGDAMIETAWAENGIARTSARWGGSNADAGVDADANYLYTVTGIHFNRQAEADLRVWDIKDGALLKKFDLTPWWSNAADMQAGGQMNGGPNTLYMRDGYLYLNCMCSCLKQVVNPVLGLENEADLVVWSNGNGDYTLDHNFAEDAVVKWVCNDYNVGPYTYTLQSDSNQFSLAPAYDMGAVSFGLLAPDGTGLGYRAFAGETAGLKYGQYMIDNGGAFDGLYSDNNNGPSGHVGLWFTAQDSFKGLISPDFSLEERIELSSPNGGETLLAGASVNIRWYSSRESMVDIDYSTDDGETWKRIASGITSSLEKYSWIVPSTVSARCLVRVTDSVDPSITDKSNAVFAITAPADSKTVTEAVEAGWIEPYIFLFDGKDYVILDAADPDDETTIPAWGGFWVGAHRTVDLLFPKAFPEPPVPGGAGLDLTLEPEVWRLVSPPLDPNPGKREMNSVFSPLGRYELNWRAAKWDDSISGYRFYSGPGTGFPEMLPGRGFWIYQKNPETRSIHLDGAPVRPDGNYYELTLRATPGKLFTAYTAGNPFWYPIHWKNLLVRSPSTEMNQVAKPAARAGAVEKWYVGIALEARDGSAVDKYNRAGVVTTPGVDGGSVSAPDLYPPDAYVNVRLRDPADFSGQGLAYDFRSSGQTEYTWEIDLSTSYSSISASLLLNNLANVPGDVRLILKDPRAGQAFSISKDYSLPVTLNAGEIRRYLLTAQVGPGTVTGTEENRPSGFGITGVNPNPFNPITSITFRLEREGNAAVRVYTVGGQLVETILDSRLKAGAHTVAWNAKGHASGVYLVSVETSGKRDTRKVTLMK